MHDDDVTNFTKEKSSVMVGFVLELCMSLLSCVIGFMIRWSTTGFVNKLIHRCIIKLENNT